MEDLLRPIYQERASHANTLGILLIEKRRQNNPLTDNFDVILFVIVKDIETSTLLKHFQLDSGKIAVLKVVNESQLDEWIKLGSNRKVYEWVIGGKVLFERNEYITQLKQELFDFPLGDRKKRIGLEFAKLIRRYTEGKELFELGHLLDAYNNIVHALHHLARLSVINNGFHPEITLWSQVRKIEPEVFKLYQELVESDEPLKKKLELLFLASEFLINSSTKVGSLHLMEVFEENEKWTIQELVVHKEIKDYSVDFEALLVFLIERKIVKISIEETKGKGIFRRIYSTI